MGKGKRNRQSHFEERLANPEKYKEQKKPFRMPKWASWTICSVIIVLVVAAILLQAMFSNGVFLRSRVLVQSSESYELNQQMATFIAWQNLYQQCYQDWYYAYYGLTSNSTITENYESPVQYAIETAGTYTKSILRDVIDSYADYFAELVAGADAGVKAGLVLDENDQIAIDEMVEWIDGIRASYVPDANLNGFLNYFVGNGVTKKDVEDAAKLMAMYTKYCDAKKYELDAKPDKNTLLTFIAKNPAEHYEAIYRAYEAASEEQAKRFESVKTEEEFTKLVVDILMEENYDSLVLSVFANPDATADKDALTKAKNDAKVEATKNALTDKLTELGIVSASYKKTLIKNDSGTTTDIKYTPELDSQLSTWLFDTKRVDGDFAIVNGENSIYLVYIFTKPADVEGDANSSVVSAGWKEYKVADYASKTEGFKEALVKDLISEKREDTTDYKSADDFAKELLETLKKDKAEITATLPNVSDVKTGVATKKPSSSSSSSSSSSTENSNVPDAVVDALYNEGNTIEKDGYYQADADGTSYVIKVKTISGTNYTVDYAILKDSDYYSIFRSIKSTMDSKYPLTAPTLDHPDLSTDEDEKTVTFEEWISESTLSEATADAPAKLTFKRVTNDVKWFKKTTTSTESSTTTEKTTYTAYIVVTPMAQKKVEGETAYGGYLKYNSEADANAALAAIQGKSGFALWHAFKALSVTTPATTEGAEDTVTSATLETNIKSDTTSFDTTVRDWFFAKDRKADNVAVVKGKDNNFYLVYFKSTTDAWSREVKDEWVVEEMATILENAIKDGGYALDESVLDKIGEPTPTESETTVATK